VAKAGRKEFGRLPGEVEIVNLIKLKARKRKGGVRPSLLSIARDLNTLGLRTKTGKLWRAQTVKNVLQRAAGEDKKAAWIKKTMLTTGDYLSRPELTRVFAAARSVSGVNELIVAVLVGSGLRASELCALQVRDLGITGGKNQIDVRRGKGAKQRSVFISAELSERLRSFVGDGQTKKRTVFVNCRGDVLNYEALYKRIKLIGRIAGLPDMHPHTLRHTFGTLLYHYRKDLFFVKEQLGHSKVDTTQIYAKTLTESKLEQMESLGIELLGLMETDSVPENAHKQEKDL